MRSPNSFIVKPKNRRYKSPIKVGGVDIEVVTSIEDAKDVSKEAIITGLPLNYEGEIEVGDEVIIHHNIFRSYYDQTGQLKHSRAFMYDDMYVAIPEEVFLYKKNGEWKPNLDFCFVEPIEEDKRIFKIDGSFLPHTGKIFISNSHPKNEIVGFLPECEYEVLIDGKLYYRMRDKYICLYERLK